MVKSYILGLLIVIALPAGFSEAAPPDRDLPISALQDSVIVNEEAVAVPDEESEEDSVSHTAESEEAAAYEDDAESYEEDAELSDLVLFIGRFHPLFVHLPIGFLLFAFLLECVSSFKRYDQLKHGVPFALLLGVLSGAAAGITGYLLSLGGGYGEDLLSSHKWFGIGVVLLSLTALILRIRWYDHPVLKRVFRSILTIMILAVLITGHYGGGLTHGSDYLFRYMPEPLLALTGVEIVEEDEQIELIEDLDTARVFDDIIHPIIRTRCESCHNPDRREGELLLTSLDHLLEGGESGSPIVANNSEESDLYRRLVLPARHDERMPPRGRRQLTNDQIRLISWWIDSGIPSTQVVSELEVSDEIFDILNSLTVAGQSFFARTLVSPANEDSLDVLRQHGFRISPVADGVHFLQVEVNKTKTSISREDIEMLLPFTEQITWLDFGRVEVTDDDLAHLSEFRHLTRLNIPNTHVTDRTLEVVSGLEHLEYLNLYATGISDEGLQHVEQLKNLKSLYVWQTNVSDEAVEDLQGRMTQVYINNGYGI